MVFIYFFTIIFSDGADSEHSYLFEIPVPYSIFECNIKKGIPRSRDYFFGNLLIIILVRAWCQSF